MNTNEMTEVLLRVNIEIENDRLTHCEKIAQEIIEEFMRVSDCIWKSPNVIEQALEREQGIIDDLIVEDQVYIASLRYAEEFKKLNHTFPKLIATGNLFSVLSLFESYIYRLALLIHSKKNQDTDIDKYLKKGVTKLFDYINDYSINIKEIKLFSQIDASIKIRNSLIHANGLLNWMSNKKSAEVQRIVLINQYLIDSHKKSGHSVKIINTLHGEQLQINNDYVFTASAYMRNFLLELCLNLEKTF